jgi:hypothetical protein
MYSTCMEEDVRVLFSEIQVFQKVFFFFIFFSNLLFFNSVLILFIWIYTILFLRFCKWLEEYLWY